MSREVDSLFYRTLVDQLPLGLFLLDEDGRLHEWNVWMAEKTDILREQALGKTLVELFPGFNHPRLNWAIEMVFSCNASQILSHTLNHYVIPIPLKTTNGDGIMMMQQRVQVSLVIKNKDTRFAMVSIVDETEKAVQQQALIKGAAQLQELSLHDPLTGLYNRRFMSAWLENEFIIAKRYDYPIAFLMIDLDHFKQINDTHGHAVGDQVLKDVIQIMSKEVRKSDVFIRHGGDEFILILSRCTLIDAMIRAKRLIDQVSHSAIGGLEKGMVTCSMGGAVCDNTTLLRTEDSLLKQADTQLYKVKQAGGNAVMPQPT